MSSFDPSSFAVFNHQGHYGAEPAPDPNMPLSPVAPSISRSMLQRREAQAKNLSISFEQIQNRLQEVLDAVERQCPLMGMEILVLVTESVVQTVESLGLTSDDMEFGVIDREGFWSGLNRCWIYALAHVNANVSDEALRPQAAHLAHFRACIGAWSDVLERYGLVDYEMGFWETEILEALAASEEGMSSRAPINSLLEQLSPEM